MADIYFTSHTNPYGSSDIGPPLPANVELGVETAGAGTDSAVW